MEYWGDFNTGATVPLYFTTHSQAGAAVAPASAFEVADIRLYKNGSATQRTSESGWTITSPFDSVTGLHCLTIDLSDNTDAGFYAAGNTYTAVLSPDETVDGLAVVKALGCFSIERVTKVNVTQFGGSAGTFSSGRPEVNATHFAGTAYASAVPTNFAALGINASGHVSRVVLTDTITTYTGDTPQTGDSFARIGATGSSLTSLAPANTALSTVQWTTARAGYLDNINNAALASVPAFPSNFASLGINGSGHISRVVLVDTITTYTGNTLQSGDSFARLGVPAGASIAADIAAIDAGGGGEQVSAFNVDKDHTWKFDAPSQVTAPNTIPELIGFIGLLSMDFTDPIPARSAITSITSAAFANDAGTEPTVTSSAITANKKGVNILIDASAATAGTYTLSVKIVTTDSQTFVRKGRITIS